MRLRTVLVCAALALAGCGGGEGSGDDFVTWATEQGGLDRETAECVETKLSEDQRAALVTIEEDTPESDIDMQAVDAMIGATVDC